MYTRSDRGIQRKSIEQEKQTCQRTSSQSENTWCLMKYTVPKVGRYDSIYRAMVETMSTSTDLAIPFLFLHDLVKTMQPSKIWADMQEEKLLFSGTSSFFVLNYSIS